MKTRILNLVCIIFMLNRNASSQIEVGGDLVDVNNAICGSTYSTSVIVRNNSNTPEEVKIYQTDYSANFNGKKTYSEPGLTQRSNANWITYSPKRAIIPPKENIPVNIQVQVPDSMKLKGSYWSMLMIEHVPALSPETIRKKQSIGIVSLIRYSVLIVTNIEKTGSNGVRFIDSKMIYENNKSEFNLDVENTGDILIKPSIIVKLYNEKNAELGPFTQNEKLLLPGSSVRFIFDLSSVSSGDYKAIVVADCGNEDIFGIQYNLKIKK